MAIQPNIALENNHYLIKNDSQVTCCILLGKNYLSYVLADASSLKIYALKHYSFQDKVLSKSDFDAILSDNQLRKASTYTVAIDSAKSTLVPTALFVENQAADYLKLSADIEPEEMISTQTVGEITDIFALKSSTVQFLEQRLKKVTCLDASACLLKTYPQQIIHEHTHTCFISVKDQMICLTIYQKQDLLLHQIYTISATEDVLYFVANSCKQLNLVAATTGIHVHGETAEVEQIVKILQPYYPGTRYITRIKDLQYPDTLYATPAHYFFNLFSIFSCVL